MTLPTSSRSGVRAVLFAAVLFAAAGAWAAPPTAADWRAFYGDSTLAQAEAPDAHLSLAVTAPGGGWAVAFQPASSEKRPRSSLRVRTPDATDGVDLEIPGTVVALLFSPRGESLFAAIRKPAGSKRVDPEVYLATIDLETLQARRLLRLPTTTSDLAWTGDGDVLLIACKDEIRTLNRGTLRSGPLFPVPGDNRAIASSGGSRLFVGQATRWIVVDLEDRPDERSLPIRAGGPLEAVPLKILSSEDGASILSVDAGVAEVRPPTDEFQAAAPDHSLLPKSPEQEPEPETSEPETPEPAAATETTPDLDPSPAPETTAPTITEPAQRSPPPEPRETPVERVEPAPQEPEADDESTREPAAAPPPVDPTGPLPLLSGRLVGPAAGKVREIVVAGPNNLLRVARRVIPATNGRWRLDDLAPGRYRLQADAGGDTRAVTNPAYLIVDIPASGEPVRAPDWTVLRID